MSIEMITIQELLRDPQYRKYFTTVPQLPSHYTPDHKPWKLIVMKKGESIWRTKRMGTYEEAFTGLKKMLPIIDNGAINCPALGFMPPTRTVRLKGKFDKKGKQITRTTLWTPKIEGDMEQHHWCAHCRRPTVFKVAMVKPKRHHGYFVPAGEPVLRCGICGASERIVNLRRPETEQRWDRNRAVVSV